MSTKTLVPRASGEGGLGATDNAWGQAYYDTGNFNKGLFVSGKNIDEIIADAVTGGGLGGVWDTAPGGIIYYNGGNVGIGTTSPNAPLEISTGSDEALRLNQSAGAKWNYLSFYQNDLIKGFVGTVGSADPDVDGGLTLTALAGQNLFLRTAPGTGANASNRVTVLNSNGNVGIGTTSPATALDINKEVGDSSPIITLSRGGVSKSRFAIANATGSILAGSLTDDLCFRAEDGNIRFGTASHTKTDVSILSNGNVGIGTNSPIAPLHVRGSNDTTFPGPGVTTIIEGTDDFDSGTAGAGVSFVGKFTANDPTTLGSICVGKENLTTDEYGAFMAFGTRKNLDGSNVSLEKMRITSTGNVGIGTNSPDAKLEVAGNSHIGGDIQLDGQISTDKSNSGFGGPTAEVDINYAQEDGVYLLTASRHTSPNQTPTFETGYIVANGTSGSKILSYFSVLNATNITISLNNTTFKAIATNVSPLNSIVYLNILRIA